MADLWMDVDTALSEVPINIFPLLDDTDFKTREESVVYNQAGLDLVWNFVTTAGAMTQTAVTPTTAGDYDWTNQGNGMYSIEIPASGGASINNDTEGFGWFTGFATGILPWRGPVIGFRAAALNNSLIDAGTTGLLAPTTAARTLDVTATGAAGIDWGNVENQTTAVDLSGTDIQLADTVTDVTNLHASAATAANQTTILGRIGSFTGSGFNTILGFFQALMRSDATTPSDLGGTYDDATDSMQAIRDHIGDGTNLTEAGGDGDHLTAINLPDQTMNITGNITGNLSGSVGSVTGNINTAAGTIQTLDALDTAQDTQHALTQGLAKYTGPYGPGIYYDDGAANTNTTLGTDGTYDNEVSTLAAATTLATSLGVNRIYIVGQSTLTLTGQTLTDYDFVGIETTDAATINLGTAASQSVLTRCRIINCTVYGEHDASDRLSLDRCFITDAPAAEVTFLRCYSTDCGLLGNFELDTSNDNVFDRWFSLVPGNGYPVVTATGAAGSVVFRHGSGGIGFQNLSASHTGSVETDGQVVFESGCNVNAAFSLRGNLTIVDNTGGMNSLTITATAQNINDKIDTVDAVADAVLVDTGTTIPATLGTPAGASMSADIAAVKAETALIVADTNELQTDWANGGRLDVILDELTTQGDTNETAIAALNDLSAAQVNAEVVDALATDTYAEPGQGAPGATISLAAKINYLYKAFRNKVTQTSTTLTIYADDGTTTDHAATVSDDGTTYTRGEIGTGA